MAVLTLIARMLLAALASGCASGPLLALAIACLHWLPGFPERWGSAGTLFPMGLLGFLPVMILAGMVLATLPAFVAGAAMWGLAARFEPAARAPAWAAAGAACGAVLALAAVWLLGPPESPVDAKGVDPAIAAFAVAGAGTALVFLAVMRLTGRLSVADGRAAARQ